VRRQQAHDLDGAAEAYGRFLEAQPRNVEALSNLGAVLAGQGRYEEAIARYRAALGVALQKMGDVEQAAAELERVVGERPDHRAAVVLLAECRFRLGQPGRAAELLTPLHEHSPDDAAVSYLLGLSLVQDNQAARGQVVLDQILKDGESARSRLLLGAIKLAAGEYAGALEDLRRAAALDPALPMIHLFLGRALLSTGDAEHASQELRQALEADPNDFEANLLLGVLLNQDGAYEDAMVRCAKAVSLRPTDAAALYQQGALELQLGRTEAARETLERVVAAAPDFAEAHVSLALTYYRLKRKADGDRERALAVKLQEKAQAEQPGAQTQGEAYRGEPRVPAPVKPLAPSPGPPS